MKIAQDDVQEMLGCRCVMPFLIRDTYKCSCPSSAATQPKATNTHLVASQHID